MINIFKDIKNVYVIAPAKAHSGGPECLQTLCYHLRNDLNINSYIYYYGNACDDEKINKEYLKYNNPVADLIDDDEKNVMIVPEVKSGIYFLKEFSKIKKIVYWLGVDGFYNTYFKKKELINFYYNSYPISRLNEFKDVVLHMAQSYYALKHLEKKGVSNAVFLGDHLNIEDELLLVDRSKKEKIVACNPEKGLEFTKKIMNNAYDIKFVELKNMTRKEVLNNLEKCMVYIDFGNFPGKDRIPREAVLKDVCIITGKNGAAENNLDISIPSRYKIERKLENISVIVNLIRDLLDNYDYRINDFIKFKNSVIDEKYDFINNLKSIFGRDY
jgi:hypothetical protein